MLFQDQQNMLNQEHVLQNHGDHEGMVATLICCLVDVYDFIFSCIDVTVKR